MTAYKVILCVVPRNQGEFITHAANDAGAFGGTIFMGRGTAANSLLQMLGFGDSAKDLVMIVSSDSKKDAIRDAVIQASMEKKRPFGVLFTLDATDFFKAGTNHSEENMEQNSEYKLITIIVNKGYADDAMDAARKAGATGGTIINARGTAKPGDAKFFGAEIVPEKDMIMIAAEKSKAQDIMDAVQKLPCLSTPGSGIAFASPAADFTVLGRGK